MEAILNSDINLGIIIFMMIFGCAAAIFHTVILQGLYNIKLRPKWLFFVLNPALIALAFLLDSKLGIIVFAIVFGSVFVLGILGMLYLAVKASVHSFRESKDATDLKGKKLTNWQRLAFSFGGMFIIAMSLILGVPYVIILVILIIPLVSSFFPNNKNKFFKIQHSLPTSTIRSVAMGLSEIRGKPVAQETVFSPLLKKQCIGYLYTVEDITTDDEGRDSYTTVKEEIVCKKFFLQDKTGQILVEPETLEFINFDYDERYKRSQRRYTEYLLKEKMDVLIVGKASYGEGNIPVFKREEIRDVFGVAPVSAVDSHNEMRPVAMSATYFGYIWLVLIALILLTPVKLKDNSIEFGKIEMKSQLLNWSYKDYINGKEQEQEAAEFESNDPDEAEFAQPVENNKIESDTLTN